MDGPGVVVAWIFPEQVHGAFSYSLAAMTRYDAMHGRHITRPEGGFICISSGPRVAESRCQVVDQFAGVHPSAEWLLFIDADMTFDPDMLERMLEVADPKEVPILGALCFQGGRETKPSPTIWRETSVEQGWYNIERVWDYPPDALCKVSATGGACILIHRNVLAAMNRPWPNGFGTLADGKTPNNYPWFSEGLVGPKGQPLGEDVAFCRKAGLLGIPVHVHTGIRTGHMKYFEITEERFLAVHEAEKAAKARDRLNRSERRKAARKKKVA
jgi:hypothetical protein